MSIPSARTLEQVLDPAEMVRLEELCALCRLHPVGERLAALNAAGLLAMQQGQEDGAVVAAALATDADRVERMLTGLRAPPGALERLGAALRPEAQAEGVKAPQEARRRAEARIRQRARQRVPESRATRRLPRPDGPRLAYGWLDTARRYPVEEVARGLGMAVDRRGAGPCPLCQAETRKDRGDKRRPIYIGRDRNRWHCYACGKGGGTIELVCASQTGDLRWSSAEERQAIGQWFLDRGWI